MLTLTFQLFLNNFWDIFVGDNTCSMIYWEIEKTVFWYFQIGHWDMSLNKYATLWKFQQEHSLLQKIYWHRFVVGSKSWWKGLSQLFKKHKFLLME